MLRSAQICKKCTILGNLKTIAQEAKHLPHFFRLLFELELFVIFIFVSENCQNSFSWGPCLVYSGLQNTWILKVKAMTSEFCPLRFRKIHIKESKKARFYFFYRVEKQIFWSHGLLTKKSLRFFAINDFSIIFVSPIIRFLGELFSFTFFFSTVFLIIIHVF